MGDYDPIMVDFNGDYAPWDREPFEWIDPFAERDRAERWKERCANALIREDEIINRLRDQHEAETRHLRAQIEGMMRHFEAIAALQNMLPGVIPK